MFSFIHSFSSSSKNSTVVFSDKFSFQVCWRSHSGVYTWARRRGERWRHMMWQDISLFRWNLTAVIMADDDEDNMYELTSHGVAAAVARRRRKRLHTFSATAIAESEVSFWMNWWLQTHVFLRFAAYDAGMIRSMIAPSACRSMYWLSDVMTSSCGVLYYNFYQPQNDRFKSSLPAGFNTSTMSKW